jgi:hypothetical protein
MDLHPVAFEGNGIPFEKGSPLKNFRRIVEKFLGCPVE